MSRFRLYLLIIGFTISLLLIESGIPSDWRTNYYSHEPLETQFNSENKKLNEKFTSDVVLENNGPKVSEQISNQTQPSIRKPSPTENIESYPPWSYERFKANVKTILNSKMSNKQLHSYLSSAFRPLDSLPLIPDSSVNRILLITYFRSGSTFLGDLLQQNWKSFFTYEPLYFMSDGLRLEDTLRVTEAEGLIEKIFRCDFNSITNYVQLVESKPENQFLFKWNKFLWSVCQFRNKTCFNPNFIRETCRRAQVHVIKVNRLHMHNLDSLLPKLNDLNINVIYLVRDPRGTINSRKKLSWCLKTNCSDINILCSEMRDDLSSFRRLEVKYPNKLTLLRYEDLANNPTNITRTLFKKIGLPYSWIVRQFLQTHTNSTAEDISKRNPYTTFRNSKTVATEWTQTLNKTDIIRVETVCADLLEQLNYQFIANVTQLIETNQTKLNITEVPQIKL